LDGIQRAATKALCEDSLLFFTRYFFKARFGQKFIVNHHHTLICDELEALVDGRSYANVGDTTGLTEIQIFNLPPRYTKTELAVINLAPWCYARNAACKFIHLSYADKLVLDNSAQVRDLIKHPEFQALWPMEFKEDTDAKGLWRNDDGGGFLASPAGGSITGLRGRSPVRLRLCKRPVPHWQALRTPSVLSPLLPRAGAGPSRPRTTGGHG
jgi:hypothetical protein